jgi:hypothetical protein
VVAIVWTITGIQLQKQNYNLRKLFCLEYNKPLALNSKVSLCLFEKKKGEVVFFFLEIIQHIFENIFNFGLAVIII